MKFPFSTLPGLLLHAGQAYRNPVALGYKHAERWHRISSQELVESVRRAGENLIALGLKPGDRVGIAAEASPFWLMADLAALGAGAITVPLFANAAPDILRHQIRDSGMRFLFAGSEELQETLRAYAGPDVLVLLLSPRQVQAVTRDWGATEPETPARFEWDARAAALKSGDTATLIYTSGSTGMPKGVELTHGNIVSQVQAARSCFPLDSEKDSALSFLPLAHIFERMVAYYYLASGTSVFFAEDSRRAGANLREVRPTTLTVVPRFLEKVHARVVEAAEQAGGLRRLGLAALRRADAKPEGAPATWKDRVYDALVYRRIRDKMGGRLRLIISGSAALEATLGRFFVNLGIPIYEGYGLTESSPVLAVNSPGHRKMGTVGRAFPGVELRIAPDGEILARGPNIMKGYFGHPEATAATIDGEGWLSTGDLGNFDKEGYLSVTGRKKELFKSATGKYVAPLPIELALMTHKLIDAAVIIAEGRPFVSVLIFPDFEALLALKQELQGEIPEFGPFLESEPVCRRFQEILDSVNSRLSAWERIRKFHIASAPPTIEGGELTPTLKLRRYAVEANYKRKIDRFYET